MKRKTLTSDQMQKLMREVVLDQPLSIKTKEAREFRKRIQKNVEEMQKEGLVPDWTLEFPD